MEALGRCMLMSSVAQLAYMDTAISDEEAKKLEDDSVLINGTDRYIVELDVFHQLHCLDSLRQVVFSGGAACPSRAYRRTTSGGSHRYEGWHLGTLSPQSFSFSGFHCLTDDSRPLH